MNFLKFRIERLEEYTRISAETEHLAEQRLRAEEDRDALAKQLEDLRYVAGWLIGEGGKGEGGRLCRWSRHIVG
jgi:hypothetical protein